MEAEFAQFIPDAWSPPSHVGLPHPADEFGHFTIDPRPSPFGTRAGAPIEAKPGLVPTDHRLGSTEQKGISPPRPIARQDGPEQSVYRCGFGLVGLALEEEKLVPQGQVLQDQV